jgi:hypothetical protein
MVVVILFLIAAIIGRIPVVSIFCIPFSLICGIAGIQLLKHSNRSKWGYIHFVPIPMIGDHVKYSFFRKLLFLFLGGIGISCMFSLPASSQDNLLSNVLGLEFSEYDTHIKYQSTFPYKSLGKSVPYIQYILQDDGLLIPGEPIVIPEYQIPLPPLEEVLFYSQQPVKVVPSIFQIISFLLLLMQTSVMIICEVYNKKRSMMKFLYQDKWIAA